MKAIITGASGFLGRNLLQYLSKLDCELYTLGRNKVGQYKHYNIEEKINKDSIEKAITQIKPDYIFHLAGNVVTNNIFNSFAVNTFIAAQILQSLTENNLDYSTKVVIIGTAAEYGLINPNNLPVSESRSTRPINLYGKSKLAQTEIALSWQNNNKKLFVLRPFNIIGPGMPSHLALGNFMNQISSMKKNDILKTGNLDTARDFIDVRDAVKIIWHLADNENAYGEIINLCSGKSIHLIKLVEKMIKLSRKDIKIKTTKQLKRKHDMKDHYGDNQKLMELLNGYDFISWEDSIINMTKSYA